MAVKERNTKKPKAPEVKLPPQDLNAEKSVLGAILLVPNVLDEVALVLRPEDFYLVVHGNLFRAALVLHNADQPVDAVTLAAKLSSEGELEKLGGIDYLTELMEAVPHGAHALYHARIVAEKAMRRAVLFAGNDAMIEAHDANLEIDEVVARSEGRLTGILERRSASQQTHIRDVLVDVMLRLTEKKSLGLMTGFCDVDKLLYGLQPANLVLVAGRPSSGKSAWAINAAMNIARRGDPVGIFSIEQSKVEFAQRMVSSEVEIAYHDLSKAENLSDIQCQRVLKTSERMDAWPCIIDDGQNSEITALEAASRLMKRRFGIKILFIDYLQLIGPADRRAPREQQVADISRRLKLLAKSLNIPVVALAQINRENEKRPDKRPILSDLRESGSQEQDADVVMFLHRPEMYDPEDRPGEAELIVSKHRNGPRGIVPLQFHSPTMTFRNASHPGVAREPQATIDFPEDQQADGGF